MSPIVSHAPSASGIWAATAAFARPGPIAAATSAAEEPRGTSSTSPFGSVI